MGLSFHDGKFVTGFPWEPSFHDGKSVTGFHGLFPHALSMMEG
jgi:hypothetical protein